MKASLMKLTIRKLIFTFVFLLLSCNFAAAQDVAELAIIRSLLGVAQNTPVITTTTVAVPKDAPFKIYLDISGDTPERDKKVRDSLIKWIDELGKGSTPKLKTLELVSDPAQANVALIQFTDFPTEIDDPRGDAPGSVDVNSRTGQPESMPLFSNTMSMTMTVFTYIVIKEPNSLKLLYRRKDPITNRSTVLSSTKQTATVSAKLRKEIDKEVDKRAMKPGSENDAKRPDIRLRAEFARWLTSDIGSNKSQ